MLPLAQTFQRVGPSLGQVAVGRHFPVGNVAVSRVDVAEVGQLYAPDCPFSVGPMTAQGINAC